MFPINLSFYNNPALLPPTISVPLIGISDVKVVNVELLEEGKVIINVESTLESMPCHQCGREATKGHGHDKPLTVRHLSVFGLETYLSIPPKRCECEHCSTASKTVTTTQQLSWRAARSPYTKAYENQVLLQLINSTIEDVSHKERLSYDAVLGIVDRHIATEVNWAEFWQIGVLGIDEVALKKGHRDYVVIISARLSNNQVKVLAILPDRKKKTVVKFLCAIPKHLRRTIHTVCTDMWTAYLEVAKLVLPWATIIVDRFHVAQKYHQAADKLRKKELNRLKKELPAEEFKKLKGAMWPFRKKKAALVEAETELLERLFSHSPQLKLAYELREQLTTIFETELTKQEATEKIRLWRQEVEASELTCFDSFLTTLDNHLDEITNYFINRYSSGFVEGLNNKVKVLKRRCYGIFNLGHFFQRLFLDLQGYSFFSPDSRPWSHHYI
jgi:transposase